MLAQMRVSAGCSSVYCSFEAAGLANDHAAGTVCGIWAAPFAKRGAAIGQNRLLDVVTGLK